jgi:intracellular septation protein
MDFFIDLVPALPFLLMGFGLITIFQATQLAMVAAVLQLLASRLRYGKVKRMHAFTFAAIIVFGAITLALHDEMFIKLKPTVLNWGFALAFLCAPLFFKKNLLKLAIGEKISMPDTAWFRLNIMWVIYFFLIGAANLYVALSFSQEVWGKFRIFGIYGALLVFMVVQGVFVYRHMEHEPQPAEGGD